MSVASRVFRGYGNGTVAGTVAGRVFRGYTSSIAQTWTIQSKSDESWVSPDSWGGATETWATKTGSWDGENDWTDQGKSGESWAQLEKETS